MASCGYSRVTGIWQPNWRQIPLQWRSNFSLLGKLQNVLHLYAKVSHRAFKLGVSQEQLHSPNVFRASVDQRCFGSAHYVGSIGGWIETDLFNP